jgi:hypothetical protein
MGSLFQVTSANLELDTIDVRPVRHVDTFVVKGLDWSREGGNRDDSGNVAVRERVVEVGVLAPRKGDRGTVRIRGCSDTEAIDTGCVHVYERMSGTISTDAVLTV